MASDASKKQGGNSYGPQNPHPLSKLQTELVWEGKYDEYGDRRSVDAAGLAMPMQRIETIDEPRARAEAQGDLFDSQKAHLDDFRNRLIWGDNKLVMASLLQEFKGSLDLIYIDPPFDVGADFRMSLALGEGSDSVEKDASALETVAYRDTWGKGTDSYLSMLYERLVLMRELLSDRGSIYVHLDWHVGHYVKALLDDVFGKSHFLNEIIWKRKFGNAAESRRLGSAYDTLFVYAKTDRYMFEPVREKDSQHVQDYIRDRFTRVDADGPHAGRQWMPYPLANPGAPTPNLVYEYKGYRPPPKGWRMVESKLAELDRDGRIYFPKERHQRLQEKKFLDEYEGQPVNSLWQDVFVINSQAKESLNYATQKPEQLLDRILRLSSHEGSLVGDFFFGSGTTAEVAERLGRGWIVADLGRFAAHTTRKRMIEVQRDLHAAGKPYRAFYVLNLGRYERQWWQRERLAGADDEHRRVVLEFFRTELLPNPPSALLHGRKGSAFCHVDGIDSIFTRDEAKSVAEAAKDAGAKQVYCLSWEFEMDLRLECNRLEKELGVEIKLIQIPREIMEKNRKEPPPFLEVATLTAEPVVGERDGKKTVDIKLTSFLPSLSEIPTKELGTLKERAMKSGFDFIDFWAVDFDFKNGAPFHHDWQDYRLRKDRSLKTTSEQRHVYDKPGTYTACVKVVDIFGSDTSITVEVPYG
jgi:adenine-specific DNA-methyltransferase